MDKSKRSPLHLSLDSGELPLKKDLFKKADDSYNQNSSTVWKTIGRLFYKTKEKQKSITTINVAKSKEFSLNRLSSYFRTKRLSRNSLVPFTVGESYNGYQAALTKKQNLNNENITAMAIKLPKGVTADDVYVTVELSMVNSNTANPESSILQEQMTMHCTEDNDSQTVFTGVLKVLDEKELTNLVKMPLYLVNSIENNILCPESQISHKKFVKTPSNVSGNNSLNEIETDDVQIKLTFNKTSGQLNDPEKVESDKVIGVTSWADHKKSKEDSVERVIMVNNYNSSEISSILKGKRVENDQNEEKLTNVIPAGTLELREKTEDFLFTSVDPFVNEDCYNGEDTGAKKNSLKTDKTNTPVLELPYLEKKRSIKDVSIQYSNSYFTATKGVDAQHSLCQKSKAPTIRSETESISIATSVEINDFTYFETEKSIEPTLEIKSSSTDTTWPSSSATTVPATSVTLLSFASDQGFYNTKEVINVSSGKFNTMFDVINDVTKPEKDSLENELSNTNLSKYETNATGVAIIKDVIMPVDKTSFILLHSDTDVDKEGKAEIVSLTEDDNRTSVKLADNILKLLREAQHKFTRLNYKSSYKGVGIKSCIPNLEEVRKVDVHLSKNPFYFPEREFNRKEQHNKKYYEDNDEYYEEHREHIQSFFQDHNLSSDHINMSKSQKNYDLYLSGDQGKTTNMGLNQFVNIEDSEHIIAIYDDVETKNKEDTPQAVSSITDDEITANFIYENIISKISIPPNDNECNDVKKEKCNVENLSGDDQNNVTKIVYKLDDHHSSSSCIQFEVASGGIQLKTTNPYNSSFSNKTIKLENCESITALNNNEKCNLTVDNSKNELLNKNETLQKIQSKNQMLVWNDTANVLCNNLSVNKQNEDLTHLDKNNKRHLNAEKLITRINQNKLVIAKPLFLKHTNKLKTKNSLTENKVHYQIKNENCNSYNTEIYQNEQNVENILIQKMENSNGGIKDLNITNTIINDNKLIIDNQPSNQKSNNGSESDHVKKNDSFMCEKDYDYESSSQICNSLNTSGVVDIPSKYKKTDSRVNIQLNKYSINSIQNYAHEKHQVPVDSKVNDLKDCLIKMNEIIITATSMSLLNKKSHFNKITDTVHNNTINNQSEINLDLSQEKQKTYEAVENDIKQVINELLKESKDIKTSVIMKGVVEESEPPFIVDYIKQEPINYTKLYLVMMEEMEKYKQKNKIIEENKKKESKQEAMYVIDSVIDNVIAHSNNVMNNKRKNFVAVPTKPPSIFHYNEGESSDLVKGFHNSSNSFERKQNSINQQITNFCNSETCNSTIYKTCINFGNIFCANPLSSFNELYISNNQRPQENERLSYSNNEYTSNLNNNFFNINFKDEHFFAEDHNRQIIIEQDRFTIALPSLASNDDSNQNFLKLTDENKPNTTEELNKTYNKLNTPELKLNDNTSNVYNFDNSDNSTTTTLNGVPKCMKQFQLTNFGDTKINIPWTSTQYVSHESTDEEVFLNDVDLRNAREFSTEEEEDEIILAPKCLSKTSIKDELFTNYSSDEDVYGYDTLKSSEVVYFEPSLPSQSKELGTNHSPILLEAKSSYYNLHNVFQDKPSHSFDSIPNLKTLNASSSSDTLNADDESNDINFNLPKHRYKSKLELNSPQEVADIEKNIKANEVLTQKN